MIFLHVYFIIIIFFFFFLIFVQNNLSVTSDVIILFVQDIQYLQIL